MDELAVSHVVPFYQEQAVVDETRLAMVRHLVFGAPAPPVQTTDSNRVTYGTLRMASQFDPIAFRAFWKIMGMVIQPNEIYSDPQVVFATRAALQRHGTGLAIPQPTREELIAALAT